MPTDASGEQRRELRAVRNDKGSAHQCVGAASVLGMLFVVGHLVTVSVTIAEQGVGWGAAAWSLDLLGFFAGLAFVFVTRKSSNTPSADNMKDNMWICVWSAATLGARVLDTLMLFGVVKLDEVYTTPSGGVLVSNIITEVVIGNLYAVTSLVGAATLRFCPKDTDARVFVEL